MDRLMKVMTCHQTPKKNPQTQQSYSFCRKYPRLWWKFLGVGALWRDAWLQGVYEWIHPGRLTWNLQITHLEKKMILQTSMIMFHVNLQGCRFVVSWVFIIGNERSLSIGFGRSVFLSETDDMAYPMLVI